MHSPAPRYSFSVCLLGQALNEEASIAEYLRRAEELLRSLSADVELIMIDDGSTDRTGAILDEFARARPWVRVVHNERNRGTGWGIKQMIPQITKDVFFWQTVDWSYDLTHLVEAMGEIDRYDVIHGVREPVWSWRALSGARSDNWQKAVISAVNYLLIRALFRLPLQDYQNITIYRRSLLQSLEVESASAFISPELLLKSWWKGARILQVPARFRPRRQGVGKGTRLPFILTAMRDIFRGWWRWIVLGQRPDRERGTVTRRSSA